MKLYKDICQQTLFKIICQSLLSNRHYFLTLPFYIFLYYDRLYIFIAQKVTLKIKNICYLLKCFINKESKHTSCSKRHFLKTGYFRHNYFFPLPSLSFPNLHLISLLQPPLLYSYFAWHTLPA